jgi:hypothetical protein
MTLLPQLGVRPFAITAACLLSAIAWIVFDAHSAVEREGGLSAARVGLTRSHSLRADAPFISSPRKTFTGSGSPPARVSAPRRNHTART